MSRVTLFVAFALLAVFAASASAQESEFRLPFVYFNCPAPSTVFCTPSPTTNGIWTGNGAGVYETSFAPNDQCANIIQLSASSSRLFCCYSTCSVFYVDVGYASCSKNSQSEFSCLI